MAEAGRPEFKPTKAHRARVEILVGAGETEDAIARVIGIDPKTLRKHFSEEILTGRAKRRGEMIETLFKTGKKGNVSAQKAYLALGALEPEPARAAAAKAESPGKKAIAAAAAQHAEDGTDWAEALADDSLAQ